MANDELIARLEAATGADRELDAAIALAIGIPATTSYGDEALGNFYRAPAYFKHYTASIDAALTLVPEGWHLASLGFIHPDFRQVAEREWQADIFGPVTWTETYDFPEPEYEAVGGNAPTPALAIVIAALKARSHD